MEPVYLGAGGEQGVKEGDRDNGLGNVAFSAILQQSSKTCQCKECAEICHVYV